MYVIHVYIPWIWSWLATSFPKTVLSVTLKLYRSSVEMTSVKLSVKATFPVPTSASSPRCCPLSIGISHCLEMSQPIWLWEHLIVARESEQPFCVNNVCSCDAVVWSLSWASMAASILGETMLARPDPGRHSIGPKCWTNFQVQTTLALRSSFFLDCCRKQSLLVKTQNPLLCVFWEDHLSLIDRPCQNIYAFRTGCTLTMHHAIMLSALLPNQTVPNSMCEAVGALDSCMVHYWFTLANCGSATCGGPMVVSSGAWGKCASCVVGKEG